MLLWLPERFRPVKKEIDVVVVCGGRGQRMGKLTEEKPKGLLSVDGKPILTHVLDSIITAFGSANVILAAGYEGEKIERLYGNSYRSISISYVHDARPIESRRRILLAREFLHTSFLVLGCDVICHPGQLTRVAELHNKEKDSVYGTLSGASQHEPALTHALLTFRDGYVAEVVFPPNPTWAVDQWRHMNVECYSPRFLRELEDAPGEVVNIIQVVAMVLREGKSFQASEYHKNWYHFAEPEDIEVRISWNHG